MTRKTMSDQTNKTVTLDWVGAEGLSFTEDSPLIELDIPEKPKRTLQKKRCECCGAEFETYMPVRQKYCKDPECVRKRKRQYEIEWTLDHKDRRRRHKRNSKEKIKRTKEIEKNPELKSAYERKQQERIDKIKRKAEIEEEWSKHGHEWGKIKAEKTLAKVEPIKLTL